MNGEYWEIITTEVDLDALEPTARRTVPRARDGRPSVWKGALAGCAGGLVASWVMSQFQTQLQRIVPQPKPQDGEDATKKTASAISDAFGHQLSQDEKETAGPAVHYAFGSLMGALYGAMAETMPATTAGFGVPFGTAVWLGADEVAVPMLGLAPAPTDTSPSVHAGALASHWIYGLTTDVVRRAVRAAL